MIIKNAIFHIKDNHNVLLKSEVVSDFNFDYCEDSKTLYLFKDKDVVCYKTNRVELISQNEQTTVYDTYIKM